MRCIHECTSPAVALQADKVTRTVIPVCFGHKSGGDGIRTYPLGERGMNDKIMQRYQGETWNYHVLVS